MFPGYRKVEVTYECVHPGAGWVILVVAEGQDGDHHDSSSDELRTECSTRRHPILGVGEEVLVTGLHSRINVVDGIVVDAVRQGRGRDAR